MLFTTLRSNAVINVTSPNEMRVSCFPDKVKTDNRAEKAAFGRNKGCPTP